MKTQRINIPTIILNWSEWYAWKNLELDVRSNQNGVRVTVNPGVYEARHNTSEERLTIGKASNLRMRVKQGLVKGKVPHSSGKKIRASEDVTSIVIRWAETDRQSAVEEELHKLYANKFGRLPKYTKRT